MYMCVYICMCMHMQSMRVCVCAFVCASTHICTHSCVHAHVHEKFSQAHAPIVKVQILSIQQSPWLAQSWTWQPWNWQCEHQRHWIPAFSCTDKVHTQNGAHCPLLVSSCTRQQQSASFCRQLQSPLLC